MSTKTGDNNVWLVGHDFSAGANAAAALALEDLLDSHHRGRLVLLHAFTVMLPPASIDPMPVSEYYTTIEGAARTEALRNLELAADTLRIRQSERSQGPLRVEIECAVAIGTPAEALLAEAEERHAARIVVGTHGRTGVAHFILGSVAERVVRLARVPVLVAHEPAERRGESA